MLTCPDCNRIIMDKTADGGYKLRSRMVIFQDSTAFALCPSCKKAVSVPILLGDVSNILAKPKIFLNSSC